MAGADSGGRVVPKLRRRWPGDGDIPSSGVAVGHDGRHGKPRRPSAAAREWKNAAGWQPCGTLCWDRIPTGSCSCSSSSTMCSSRSGGHGRLAIIVTAMWLGLTVLLAFRTSEVPHRLMLMVRVAVGVIVIAAVAVAFGGGNRAYGTIVILWSLLVAGEPDRHRMAGPAPHTRDDADRSRSVVHLRPDRIGLRQLRLWSATGLGELVLRATGTTWSGRLRLLQLHHHGHRRLWRSVACRRDFPAPMRSSRR